MQPRVDFYILTDDNRRSVQQQHIERIAEVLNQQANNKQTGREHYKTYRASGFESLHHEMKPS